LPTSTRPLRNPNYRLEQMDNELLLFNPHSQLVLYLNESASIIWQLCDGQRSIPQITEIIGEAYPEAAGSIPTDVHETIQLLIDKGVVTLV